MAKKKYSAAEKVAFKHGMAAQYNKEHPKYHYAVANRYTKFNEDGSVFGKPYHGAVTFFKTKAEAEKAVAERNKIHERENAHVLAAVKKKKVNVYNSADSSISWSEYKHIEPTRDIGYQNFGELKSKRTLR